MTSVPLVLESTSSISHYGKACTHCSKAKCKCSFIEGKDVCERCNRLRKDCRPLIPARRKSVRPKSVSSTTAKHQRLERRLDDLVSLLQAQGNPLESISSPIPAVDDQPNAWISRIPEAESTSSVSTTSISTPTSTTAPTPPYQNNATVFSPTSVESQHALDRFRDGTLTFLPFMYLPTDMTVLQLSHDFPILWISISAISAKSMSHLCAVSDQLQSTILDKIFIQGERTTDLLLAILSLAGWFRHQRKRKSFLSMWTQTAASLAIELGLDRSTSGETTIFHNPSTRHCTRYSGRKCERSMLERRAILTTFMMTSWAVNSFRKSNAIKWTPHMGECLRILEQQPEWEGDNMLALQVRCQLIIEQIYESPWLGGLWNGGSKLGAPDYFIKSINMQLQEVRVKLGTFTAQRDDILQLFVLDTELTKHEASQELPISMDSEGIIDHRKLEPFFNALYSIKAWVEIFFKIPIVSYSDITFCLFSQFVHCIVSLYRLSTLDDPSWDRNLVKQTLDVIKVTEKFGVNVEQARDLRKLAVDNDAEDLFIQSAMMMRKLKEAWYSEIAAIGAESKGQMAAGNGEVQIPSELMDLDMLGSEWITDMFLAWDH